MPRGRKPGFRMPESHRDKIKNSNVLRALIDHVEGKREMSGSQVTAGLGLLRKVLPDLASVELAATIERTDVRELTRDQLLDIAAAGSAGTTETGRRREPSDSVH